MVVGKNLLFFEEDIWKKLFSNDIFSRMLQTTSWRRFSAGRTVVPLLLAQNNFLMETFSIKIRESDAPRERNQASD